MNCCGDEKSNHQSEPNKKHNPMKHMWMMALCCGLPILLILALPFIGIFGSGAKTAVAAIAPFLCPIMMLVMMPMMMRSSKGKGSCCESSNSDSEQKKTLLDK